MGLSEYYTVTECKVIPLHTMRAYRGRRGISLPILDGRRCVVKLHKSAALPMERTLVPMEQEAGWSPELVWAILENRKPLPGFKPQTIQPVATRYTEYIILPHCILCHAITK
jgi:hypothetical protein